MASRIEIVDALEGLALHCRPPLMSVEDRSRWMNDWCEDLKEFPIDAIKLACSRWRGGDNPKFPMIKPFRALIQSVNHSGGRGDTGPQLWGPVSDDDYRRMSLVDKIRHQEILGTEARSKAGPMWKDNRPRPLEDMPRSFFEWREKAEHHFAEAKALKATLKAVERRA